MEPCCLYDLHEAERQRLSASFYELRAAGWQEQVTHREPSLSEAVQLYRQMGLRCAASPSPLRSSSGAAPAAGRESAPSTGPSSPASTQTPEITLTWDRRASLQYIYADGTLTVDMNAPVTYPQLQYLLFGGVLLLVAMTTATLTPGGEQHPWTSGDCESCHSEFEPARLEVELVPQGGQDYELRAIVRNPGDHEVLDLEARLQQVNDSQVRQGPELNENQEYTFRWTLSAQEAHRATVQVDLTARHEHERGRAPDRQAYTLVAAESGLVMKNWERQWALGLGQALGLTMAVLMAATCVTGLYQSGRLKTPAWVARASPRHRAAGHRLVGLVLLGLALPHALLLQTGLYRGTTGGLFSGLTTFISLSLLTYITL